MTTGSQELASVRSLWWIPLLQGLVALVIGFALFGQPAKTLAALTLWLGIFWLADGVLNVFRSLTGPRGSGRGWLLFIGLLGILAGIVVLAQPAASGLAVLSFGVAFLAVALILNGLSLIFGGGAIHGPTWVSVVLGILYVLGGVLLFSSLVMSGLLLLTLFGVLALVAGVMYIVFAFQLRTLGR